MPLIDYIENKKSKIPEIVEELKNSKYPVFLLGAGDRAAYLYHFLTSQQVKIEKVVVNRKYFAANSTLQFENKEYAQIECFEDALEAYPKINIVLGFSEKLVNKAIFPDKVETIWGINIGVRDDYNFTYEYICKNLENFEKLYTYLEDELSKQLLTAHINGRIQGIDMDATPMGWTDPQYFLEEFMKYQEYECIMDCGAYFGDTAEEFIQKAPMNVVKDYKVYCWEPDSENYEKLQEYAKINPSIIPLKYGTYSDAGKSYFNSEFGERACLDDVGDIEILLESIDHIAGDEKVTFIKMDIEGSELEAIKGAKKVISRDKPRLAICVYHKQEDLITIPQLVKELVPEYKIFLRSHSKMPSELVMFALL